MSRYGLIIQILKINYSRHYPHFYLEKQNTKFCNTEQCNKSTTRAPETIVWLLFDIIRLYQCNAYEQGTMGEVQGVCHWFTTL